MRIAFTKMHGAGNDFVVLDETRHNLGLTAAHYRFLGDRHFGVGADQILGVRPAPTPGVDFEYVIHNADGEEVEHCGNGARCFLKFVRERGLTSKDMVRVQTMNRVLDLRWQDNGHVQVDMGRPEFALDRIPFKPGSRQPRAYGDWEQWPVPLAANSTAYEPRSAARRGSAPQPAGRSYPEEPLMAVLSMGNPHAVVLVDDVAQTDVASLGPAIQLLGGFPDGVNVGFLQVRRRDLVQLRVYERGAGETLACGTGACAAVVAARRLGLLDQQAVVATRGGELTVTWAGGQSSVCMSGPASTVFVGEIELPDTI